LELEGLTCNLHDKVITATAAHDAECVSDHRATQESEHQDKKEATIDPQDDPQDVDLKRGATNNPQDNPQDPDPRIPDLEADLLDSDQDREV